MASSRLGLVAVAAVLSISATILLADDKAPPLAVAPFDPVKAKQHQEAWAKHLKADVEVTNSIGMVLTLIPAGEFNMGWANREDANACGNDAAKPHRVRLTRPFYLGTYEVTRGEFRKFVTDRGYQPLAKNTEMGTGGMGFTGTGYTQFGYDKQFSWQNPGFAQTDRHPAVNLNWDDASEFCKWLSKREGNVYRLPTEAEWEFACRAGTATRWSGGNEEGSLKKTANVADESLKAKYWPAKMGSFTASWNDNHPFTAPVGSFAANAFGLHDMHGNVAEWCNDRHDIRYYSTSPVDNPPGPASGSSRVLRGGSWMPMYWGTSCARRDSSIEYLGSPWDGFRVVQVPKQWNFGD